MTSHEILSNLADEYIKAIEKKAENRYSDFDEELRAQHHTWPVILNRQFVI